MDTVPRADATPAAPRGDRPRRTRRLRTWTRSTAPCPDHRRAGPRRAPSCSRRRAAGRRSGADGGGRRHPLPARGPGRSSAPTSTCWSTPARVARSTSAGGGGTAATAMSRRPGRRVGRRHTPRAGSTRSTGSARPRPTAAPCGSTSCATASPGTRPAWSRPAVVDALGLGQETRLGSSRRPAVEVGAELAERARFKRSHPVVLLRVGPHGADTAYGNARHGWRIGQRWVDTDLAAVAAVGRRGGGRPRGRRLPDRLAGSRRRPPMRVPVPAGGPSSVSPTPSSGGATPGATSPPTWAAARRPRSPMSGAGRTG